MRFGQSTGEIRCRERLGGMLRYYYREAARESVATSVDQRSTYARIADTLGVAEGTIGWILHRARRSLRTSLNDLIEDER